MKNFMLFILFASRIKGLNSYGTMIREWVEDMSEQVADVDALVGLILDRLKAYLDLFGVLDLYEDSKDFWERLARAEILSFEKFKVVKLPSPEDIAAAVSKMIATPDMQTIIGILRQKTRADLLSLLEEHVHQTSIRSRAMVQSIIGILRNQMQVAAS